MDTTIGVHPHQARRQPRREAPRQARASRRPRIHGNKSQERAGPGPSTAFGTAACKVLVATDVAARGIDVDGITHVVNFDLPHPAEVYVHRIGRTGRAGRDGVAISFCDETEGEYLAAIEALTGVGLPVDGEHRFHSVEAMMAPRTASKKGGGGRGGGGGGRGGRGGRGGGGGRGGRRGGGGRGGRR